MINAGTKLICECANGNFADENSTAVDLPPETIYECLKCRRTSTLQKLVDNHYKLLKTSPAVQDPQFITPPDPGPPPTYISAEELEELLRPRLGHDERIERLKALGFTSADYHCGGRVWVGCYFIEPDITDRLILIMEKYDQRHTQFFPTTDDLAALGGYPYENDARTPQDVLIGYEQRFKPSLTPSEPEYQI